MTECGLTLDALLRERARRQPDHPVLVMAEEPLPLTTAQWFARAGAAAAWLAERGIGAGDRIALWGQNSQAWAIWLAAASWRGAALVALHPGLSAREFDAMLAQCRPAWLITDEVARGVPLGAIAQAAFEGAAHGGLRGLTVMPGGDGVPILDRLLDLEATPPAPQGSADAPLCYQATSGSSGQPKLVALSHRALLRNARDTARAAGIGAHDVLASPLPLYHAAGLSSGLLLALEVGASWCSVHRFQPSTVLGLAERRHCTVVQGVPTMFRAMTEQVAEGRAARPSTLRLGFIGGAACPESLCRRAVQVLGLARMCITYGQTEFGPTISLTRGDEPAELAWRSVGVPIDGAALRIVDPSTLRDVADGMAGEIWVRGPTRCDGYFDDPQATAAALIEDGWLRTGDLGRRAQGRLQIVGRIRQMIIRGGENVAPDGIEEVLRQGAAVQDACVVPLASEHWGEAICAVILHRAGERPDPALLRELCESRLARYARPDRYLLRTELPLLPSGKIDRQAVMRLAAQEVAA